MGPNPQGTVELATFTEEILNGKLHFLCSDMWEYSHIFYAVNIMKVKKVVKLYSNNVVLLLQDNFNLEHHLTKKFVIDSKIDLENWKKRQGCNKDMYMCRYLSHI